MHFYLDLFKLILITNPVAIGLQQTFIFQYNDSPAASQRNTKAGKSNQNGLLSQKVCRHLDQGRTSKDILMRAAHLTLSLAS